MRVLGRGRPVRWSLAWLYLRRLCSARVWASWCAECIDDLQDGNEEKLITTDVLGRPDKKQ